MLGRIRRAITAGDWSAADRQLEDYLIQNPDDSEGLYLAAQTSIARGNIDQAVSLLDAAAAFSSEPGRIWRAQAALLLAQNNRSQEAIERLEALVREFPDFNDARHRLAELLNRQGFRFDANEHVRELCRRGGASPELLGGLFVPTRSYSGSTTMPNLGSREEVDQAGPLDVARAQLDKRDVKVARDVLEASQLVREKNPAAIAFYGLVLLESQDFAALDQWARDASPECRRYPDYWMAIGGLAMQRRKYDQAVRLFAEALLREPGALAANDRMTQSLAAAGRGNASIKFRKRAEQVDSLLQLARQIVADPSADVTSIDQLSRGLREIGRSLESLAWYEVALRQMGAPAEAMSQVEQARRLLPDSKQPAVQSELLCGLTLDEFPLELTVVSIDAERESPPAQPSSNDRPSQIQPSFVNVASQVGLEFAYRNAPVPVEREFRIFQQLGAGVACLDFDLDGNVDFYVGQASGEPPRESGTLANLLVRNLDGQFVDVTESARCDDRGYTCGVTAGDWNQDGLPDLVVGNILENSLLINQGDGTFRIQAGDAVWNAPRYTASLAMGDVDGDHLPDIVEVNYLDDSAIYDPIQRRPDGTPIELPRPLHFQAAVDRVFLSRGDGSLGGQELDDFEGTSAATGLGVVVTNIDGKLGNEIFVVNDHRENHLWERAEDSGAERGGWTNTAAVRGVAFGARGMPLGCMGIAAADFDQNGRLDFHVTNFEQQWSNHFMQTESGFFDDLVVAFGLHQSTYRMLGFGTQAIDYDNNTSVDLIIGNGHVEDYQSSGGQFQMRTQLFTVGDGGRFEEVQVSGDPGYWDAGHLSRGLARCDWNKDGKLDVVVTDLQQPLALLENRTDTNYHWLQLKLVGKRCERDAIGATVTASFDARKLTKFVQSGDGYMAKNEPIVTFGLGRSNSVQRLEIAWPDGERQVLTDVSANQRWLVVQGEDAFPLEQ